MMAAAAILFALAFRSVLLSEIRYALSPKMPKAVISQEESRDVAVDKGNVLVPADEQFGIVIPKIEANAKVIANVDAQNPAMYQRALARGVAHASGSALPGETGNIFIFAHSGQDVLEANRYNAVFYLLSKLEKEDEIYIFFENKKYIYRVTDKKTATPEEVEYMDGSPSVKTLTLMTCWPGGTTWKRLVVQADQI